jgi:hypothetical protein
MCILGMLIRNCEGGAVHKIMSFLVSIEQVISHFSFLISALLVSHLPSASLGHYASLSFVVRGK